jgi:hypothetical protein
MSIIQDKGLIEDGEPVICLCVKKNHGFRDLVGKKGPKFQAGTGESKFRAAMRNLKFMCIHSRYLQGSDSKEVDHTP